MKINITGPLERFMDLKT